MIPPLLTCPKLYDRCMDEQTDKLLELLVVATSKNNYSKIRILGGNFYHENVNANKLPRNVS